MNRQASAPSDLDRLVGLHPDLALVIFDFDGTLSWLRHGWPEMMCRAAEPFFPHQLEESPEALRELMLDEIMALNGQPSIAQCERLAEMIRARSGEPPDAESLRQNFQATLDDAIERRSERLRQGAAAPDDYLIAGARDFLHRIAGSRLTPVLLSSTIQARVEAEAELLGVRHYFGDRLYGGQGDPRQFSKHAVMERLLAEHKVSGAQLLSFGDGPAETRAASSLGGLAVAVCSDEERHASGVLDERKQTQLCEAGASLAIADFCEAGALLDLIGI